MPDDSGPQQPVNADNILNVVLAANNQVFWWKGLEGEVHKTNYSNRGLRDLLLKAQQQNDKLMVLIKPKDDSKYENMIDVLDEIRITAIQRYAIVDYTDDDAQRILTGTGR